MGIGTIALVAAGPDYIFGPFHLDTRRRQLLCDGTPVPLTDRHLTVLERLAAGAGEIVSKDALAEAGWGDVAVTDNSVEQAISALRRALGAGAGGAHVIETCARRGYRLTLPESLNGVGRVRQVVIDAARGSQSRRIA